MKFYNIYIIEIFDNIIQNSSDLSMLLLNEKFIVTVAGQCFGSDKNIRFSYATSENIILEMLNRLDSLLQLIK